MLSPYFLCDTKDSINISWGWFSPPTELNGLHQRERETDCMNDQGEGEGSSDFSWALLHLSRYGMGVREQLLDLLCSPASSARHSDQRDGSPGSFSLSRTVLMWQCYRRKQSSEGSFGAPHSNAHQSSLLMEVKPLGCAEPVRCLVLSPVVGNTVNRAGGRRSEKVGIKHLQQM